LSGISVPINVATATCGTSAPNNLVEAADFGLEAPSDAGGCQ